MSTDLTLDALDIISLYGFRFKIEHMFRQAVHQVGSLLYHFWMMEMTPLRYRNGNQYLHRKSERYRKQVRDKIHAYHTFIQTGIIAHGLAPARVNGLIKGSAHRLAICVVGEPGE
jgi:UDP-2,3-diacylglucosamine pyrophosphatase LpxH